MPSKRSPAGVRSRNVLRRVERLHVPVPDPAHAHIGDGEFGVRRQFLIDSEVPLLRVSAFERTQVAADA